MSIRDTMLEIAQAVITRRASLDGYTEGEYDPHTDEDGFIISILNAIHHWCHEHGHDWTTELHQAQCLFEEDLEAYRQEQNTTRLSVVQ